MAKHDVVLFADDGELMVGRRTSSFIWGAWEVEAPEGVLSEEDQLLAEYKGFGYLYRPDDYASWDRFDLLGSRGDVSQKIGINKEGLPDFSLGESDTEDVIDEVNDRTSQDIFFQNSIKTAGLGEYLTPGRDFDVGDTVNVNIGGKLVNTVVRKITATSSDDGEVWDIEVGGKPIKDIVSLSAENALINKKVREENQKMMQQVAEGKVTMQKLTKYLGIGEGSVDGEVTSTLVDGLRRDIETTKIQYENFDKTIVEIKETLIPQLTEQQKKIDREQMQATVDDAKMKIATVNRDEIRELLKPPIAKNTPFAPNTKRNYGRMVVHRQGDDLVITGVYFPFDVVYNGAAHTVDRDNVTLTGIFAGAGDDDVLISSRQRWREKEGSDTPPISGNDTMPTGDINGTTGKATPIEFTMDIHQQNVVHYFWLYFTTIGTGRRIKVEQWNADGTKLLETKNVEANEPVHNLFPRHQRLYQYSLFGAESIRPEKRIIRVFVEADIAIEEQVIEEADHYFFSGVDLEEIPEDELEKL